jgi:hypothetical protein
MTITVEEAEELLPWQLRGKEGPRRVEKTFMFSNIEGPTTLPEEGPRGDGFIR